jgi:hypothetical protein
LAVNTSTIYRLARQGDYPKLHRFAEAMAMHDVVYQKPTIVVERDGALVGFAATRRWGDRVTVGPVVIADTVRLKGLVAIRAVLEIEQVLKEEGRLYYLIGTTDAGLMRICEAFGCTSQGMHEGEHWYIRHLRHDAV